MPNGPSHLPQITKFLAGLITNRSPIDVPITRIGLQVIEHHDALIGGSNMEVSVFGTLRKRPGFQPWNPSPASIGIGDAFAYKDLNGNLSYFFAGLSGAFFKDATQINSGAGITNPWSAQGRGNFLYLAAGGSAQYRMVNTALTTPTQFGITPPNNSPQVFLQPLNFYSVVSGFAPVSDVIGGVVQVNDPVNQRSMTITIGSSNVHFNVTYTGNVITPNQSYTQITNQTVVGSTTTNVVTVQNGFKDTITGTGITNGVANYYPNTGVSTLDFDWAIGGAATIPLFVGAISGASSATLSGFSNVPPSASAQLKIFMTANQVAGLITPVGGVPVSSTPGVAISMTSASGIITNQMTVNSGLNDLANPQYSLAMSVGSAPRLYAYQSPLANITDVFNGAFTIKVVGSTTVSHTFAAVNLTLSQIVSNVNAILGTAMQALYIQNGTTAYAIFRSLPATSNSNTQDVVLTLESNSLANAQAPFEDYTHWIFTSSNDWSQLPKQGVQISYALRDPLSGGLSNTAPPAVIGPQLGPVRWETIIPGGLSAAYAVEVYRTVDGGSSFLYEQNLAPSSLQATYTITDSGLNNQLIGPINESNDPPPRGLRSLVYHTNRFFGVVDDKVYYSGGPETINGNGDEAWPPGNFFQYPGTVIDIKSTDQGLIVSTINDLYRVSGVDSSSYYSQPWLRGFGIPAHTAWDYDGQSLYVYTSRSQLHALSPSGGKEIGFPVGNLITGFGASAGVTFHRASSLDTAIYLTNDNFGLRYDPVRQVWSTIMPGAFRFKSLETANNGFLLFQCVNGVQGVLTRNLSIFTDNGVPYASSATIGVLPLTPLGTHTAVESISGYFTAVGSVPTVSILFNEIAATTAVPFLQLFNPVNEPVNGRPPQTIYAKRWSTRSTIQPFPDGWGLVNLVSVNIAFPAEAQPNEILGIYLRDTI